MNAQIEPYFTKKRAAHGITMCGSTIFTLEAMPLLQLLMHSTLYHVL